MSHLQASCIQSAGSTHPVIFGGDSADGEKR